MNGNYNLFVKQSLLKCLYLSSAISLKISAVISNNYLKISVVISNNYLKIFNRTS